jgi:hypothetical protein
MFVLQWETNHMAYNFDVRNGPVSNSWFKGGTTNLAFNCLDRNIEKGLGNNTCFIWEGNEPGAHTPNKHNRQLCISSTLSVCCFMFACWSTVPLHLAPNL